MDPPSAKKSRPGDHPPTLFPINRNEFDERIPTFNKPAEVGHFSISAERKLLRDRSQLRVLKLPEEKNGKLELNFDLDDGYDRWIERDDVNDKEYLDIILRWILEERSQELSKSFLRQACFQTDFVSWRGSLTKLAATPFEQREGWIMCAVRFRGLIFICEYDTEARKAQRAKMTDRERHMMYWGYRFEHYVTEEAHTANCSDKQSPDVNQNVNSNGLAAEGTPTDNENACSSNAKTEETVSPSDGKVVDTVSPSNEKTEKTVPPSSNENMEETVPSSNENMEETVPPSNEKVEETVPPSNEKVIEAAPPSNEKMEETVPPSNEKVEETVAPSNEKVEETVSPSDEKVVKAASPSNEKTEEMACRSIEGVSTSETSNDKTTPNIDMADNVTVDSTTDRGNGTKLAKEDSSENESAPKSGSPNKDNLGNETTAKASLAGNDNCSSKEVSADNEKSNADSSAAECSAANSESANVSCEPTKDAVTENAERTTRNHNESVSDSIKVTLSTGKTSHSAPVIVNTSEQYCSVVRTKLANTHRLLFAGEVDCIDPATGTYVELKTSREFTHPRQESNFWRFKTLKWWLQSYLIGIPRIICGFRDDSGLVRSLRSFPVVQLPENAWAQPGGQCWTPGPPLNFLFDLLTFLKEHCPGTEPYQVLKLEYKPEVRRDQVFVELIDPESDQYRFLPDWFVKAVVEQDEIII